MPHTNHPPRLEILKNAQRRIKTNRTIKSFGLLMDNKLKGKPGTCRTENNSISRLRCVWLKLATVEREPLDRVTLCGVSTG
jgi:hypothetical protein